MHAKKIDPIEKYEDPVGDGNECYAQAAEEGKNIIEKYEDPVGDGNQIFQALDQERKFY